MTFSEKAWQIFEQAVNDFHLYNNVNTTENNPFPDDSLERILYSKNWIDTVQWHLEDDIREEEIDPAKALEIKRKIDASNQKRTDEVENLDQWFLQKYQGAPQKHDAKINTETPAWAVDRLSILALKIYHMAEEANRETADDAHRAKCRAKLDILKEQQKDLSTSIDQLLFDIENGNVKMKLYKQMKMYNDESLNPVLYQKERK